MHQDCQYPFQAKWVNGGGTKSHTFNIKCLFLMPPTLGLSDLDIFTPRTTGITVNLGPVLLGSTVFGWFGWLSFSCSIGRKPFSVGMVDQLFQPAQSLVETVENNG